jgi:hypothetical protein
MSKPKFSFVTAILLLLLVAAAVNTYFIFHAYYGAMDELEHPSAEAAPGKPNFMASGAVRDVTATDLAPNWHGDISLLKAPPGYDIVVDALSNDSNKRVTATAAEIDIRQPGDAAPDYTPKLSLWTVGQFKGHVDLAPGTWEIRVHIHRGFQTLEFAEKFELKD